MTYHPLELLPLWAFFLLTCLIVALPLEIGYRLGQHRRVCGEDDLPAGVIVSSILALLAFLLAFTFSLAASRFESRRQVVLEEANAIGTTYLRTSLLPEPQRSEIAALLRQYVEVRLKAAQAESSVGEIAVAVSRSVEIQGQLWKRAMSAAERNPTVMTGLFIGSLNEMIDAHGKRVLFGLRSSIPVSIWLGLFGVAMVGLASAGFQTGCTTTRRVTVVLGLILAFAVVLTMIADLDHPGRGFLRTTQSPMMDLQKSMNPY